MNRKFTVATIAFIFAVFNAIKGIYLGAVVGDSNDAIAHELVALTFILISIAIKKIFYRD